MNRVRTLVAIPLTIVMALGASGMAAAGAQEDERFGVLQQQLGQLQAQLRQLAQENRELREHLERIDARAAVPPADVPTTAAAAGAAANSSALPVAATGASAPLPSPAEGLRLWGYGEMYYTDPSGERSKAQADLARAVFGIGYSFDERTEFNSEYEVEHAVSSASDVGEFEVEQFYVDRSVNDAVSVRGGLFLMPFGFLNEHHEPTHFYGVQRNFIETLIIPSTWREGGLSVHGGTAAGVGWNLGLTTGFDLSKWDFAPQFPTYTSALELQNSHSAPLPATHQELALANARDLSQYAALSYYGVPGLALGGAVSTGNAVKVALPANASSRGGERVTLWEAHARWTPARWELSALYARGSIGNLGAVNAAHPGSVNPLPSSFYGYFLEGAYTLWEQGTYRATPFVRFERYELGAGYSGTRGPVIPSGLVPLSAAAGDLGYWPQNHDRVWSAGANFYLGPHLVVKGDYQWFQVNQAFRRFDLGLGVSF